MVVLLFGGLIAVAAMVFIRTEVNVARGELANCTVAPPEPGPARSWEASIRVSTYSSVNTRNRNLFTVIPILGFGGIGPDMNLALYHNSANTTTSLDLINNVGFTLGTGWTVSYSDQIFVDPATNDVTVAWANGTVDVHLWNGTTWVPPQGIYDSVVQVDSTTWRVHHKGLSFHEFNYISSTGVYRLSRIVDSSGNASTLSYDTSPYGCTSGKLCSVSAAGRTVYFVYDTVITSPTVGRLIQIFDPRDESDPPQSGEITDRYWTFSYNANGWLVRITDPGGFQIDIDQNEGTGLLTSVSNKHAGTETPDLYSYTYHANRTLQQVFDPSGSGLSQGFYGVCVNDVQRFRYTDRRGNQWWHYYNEDGNRPHPDGNLNRVMDPLNNEQWFGYYLDRNLAQYTDSLGHTWGATYDSAGNLTLLLDPLMNAQTFTYDSIDNLTSFADADGSVVRLYYEDTANPTLLTALVEPSEVANPPINDSAPAGFPVTRLFYFDNGAPGCASLTQASDGYGCQGQPAAVIDPNGVVTSLSYDQWGQPFKYGEGTTDTSGGSVAGVMLGWSPPPPSDSHIVRAQLHNSGGVPTDSSGNGGSAGECDVDVLGNIVGCGCISASVSTAASTPAGWPKSPPSPRPLPALEANFSGATYNANGQQLSMPLSVKRVLNSTELFSRTFTNQYDLFGRLISRIMSSNESGINVDRAFTYQYDDLAGTMTRTGPDGVDTFIALDAANRVSLVRRGPSSLPDMEVTYSHLANGMVDTVANYNGSLTDYVYDAANRVTRITHLEASGDIALRLSYLYDARGLPRRIDEESGSFISPTWIASTVLTYDRRGRLINENRVSATGATNYTLAYEYDLGGNRTQKRDILAGTCTGYTYDIDAPSTYGSANNRLKEIVEYATADCSGGETRHLWYDYNDGSGNPTRIISKVAGEICGGGATQFAAGGLGWNVEATSTISLDGGGGTTQTASGGSGTQYRYRATRFGYAQNGEAVTVIHDEQWCWDGTATGTVTDHKVNWAREFRYDGARARYLVRNLDPNDFNVVLSEVWSDYDGSTLYGDYDPGSGLSLSSHEPGIWRSVGGVDDYLHSDMIGTLRITTDESGVITLGRVFTAFGEQVAGPRDRNGYAGAWGYQADTVGGGWSEFDFLHVGARYYDPGSGRFLQRDPIGIGGGFNVYKYAGNVPTVGVDPTGLFWPAWLIDGLANQFWRRIHSDETLANMTDGRATAEAVAVGTAGGIALFYGGRHVARYLPVRISPHAAERMAERGLTRTVVTNAIRNGTRSAANKGLRSVWTYDNVRVVTTYANKVITCMKFTP